MQRAGDVLYVPEGWFHATLNLGETASLASQAKDFTDSSPRNLSGDASQMMYAAKLQPKGERQMAQIDWAVRAAERATQLGETAVLQSSLRCNSIIIFVRS